MFRKKVIQKYETDKEGKLAPSRPVLVDYDKEQKIDYYKKRMKDKSLTDKQREYAAGKVKMLESGKGVIAITKDENFKGGKGKIRRVMVSGVNTKTGEKMVNRITSRNAEDTMKLNRKNIPILQKESYLEQEVHVKKKKGDSFKDEDLQETSSTVNPFQFKKIFHFIFKGKKGNGKSQSRAKNNVRLGKDYKN